MAVVEAEEPLGHLGPAGEPGGLVGEEERLLAQADRPPLAGHLVEPARADPDQHRGDRDRRDQPRSQAVGRGRAPAPVRVPDRSVRRRRIAAAHSPKFQAVTVPTTAANWWLFRVACKLRTLNATKSSSRNGLSRQPTPGSAVPACGSRSSRPSFVRAFAIGRLACPFALLVELALRSDRRGSARVDGLR